MTVASVRTVAGSLAKSLPQRMIGCQDVARLMVHLVCMAQSQRTGDLRSTYCEVNLVSGENSSTSTHAVLLVVLLAVI